MKKIQVFGPLLSIMIVLLATVIIASAAQEDKVYFGTLDGSAEYGDTAEVELRVDATTFRSGEMEFTYDLGCWDVVGFEGNTDDFAATGWNSPIAGRERITFYASGDLTGDYLIGTLTIRCENQDECTTYLEFDEGVSMLFASSSEISATWEDRTFSCGNGEVKLLEKETVYNDESTPFVSMVSISVVIILALLIRRKRKNL